MDPEICSFCRKSLLRSLHVAPCPGRVHDIVWLVQMWGGVKGLGKTGFRISPFWASCGGFFLKVLQGLSQQDWAVKGRLIFLPVPCMAWHESVCNVSWCMDVIAENPAREPRAVLSTGCHPLLNTKCTRVLAIPSQTSLIPSRMEGAQIF